MFTELNSITDEKVKEIIKKLPFYNKDCIKNIKIKDSSFGLTGRNAVQSYFENKYPVKYVVVQNVTSKSIYLKLYKPRKDSYRGYLCDYYFEVYHLNGGCREKYLYIYTIVRKDKSCNRTYEKSVWAIGDTNFEIVVNKINLINGKVESVTVNDYVLEFEEGNDLVEKYNLYRSAWDNSMNNLFTAITRMIKNNGFTNPFMTIDTSHFFPSVRIRFKVGGVDADVDIMINYSILNRIYREEYRNTILNRVNSALRIIAIMKQLFNISKKDSGLITLMLNYDSEKIKDFAYTVENDEYAVFKYPSLRLPVIEGGAHHLYVKKPIPNPTVLKLLKSLIMVSGINKDRGEEYYKYFTKILSDCQITGESVFYVKHDKMGIVLTTSCGPIKKHFVY